MKAECVFPFRRWPPTLIAAKKKCLFCLTKFVRVGRMKTKTPRINHGDLDVKVCVRLPVSLCASLDAVASWHGWTRSDAVRKLLSVYLLRGEKL